MLDDRTQFPRGKWHLQGVIQQAKHQRIMNCKMIRYKAVNNIASIKINFCVYSSLFDSCKAFTFQVICQIFFMICLNRTSTYRHRLYMIFKSCQNHFVIVDPQDVLKFNSGPNNEGSKCA